MRFRAYSAIIAATFQVSSALAQVSAIPTGIPVDEQYRREFENCDRNDRFGAVQFPIRNSQGKTIWYGCKSDPSRFAKFEKIAATANKPAAVILVSKIAHDKDGSWAACNNQRGPTDQCPTSLMLDPTPSTPCIYKKDSTRRCVPVNADTIPYVVIPTAAPAGIEGGKFRSLSGLATGDYGVVIANGKTIPVIIADEGPAYKIGEGSTALLKALSPTGNARTIAAGATFILFPNSHDPVSSLTPETLAETVKTKGMRLYHELLRSN